MANLQHLYTDYGEYNIFFDQLNLPSPSVEYAWRKTKKMLEEKTIKIINTKKGALNICDLGCGNGALLIRLAETTDKQVSFKGYDLSPAFVDYANKAAAYKKIPSISFSLLDIEKDELPDKYDIIICSEVLEHIKNYKLAINKLYKALNLNGYLLISTPNAKNLIKYPFLFLKGIINKSNSQGLGKYLTEREKTYKLAEMEQHIQTFSHEELKSLLKSVGFKNLQSARSTTFFGGPFLDNHPFLFTLSIIFDQIFDHLPFPQIGWDNIIFSQRLD